MRALIRFVDTTRTCESRPKNHSESASVYGARPL